MSKDKHLVIEFVSSDASALRELYVKIYEDYPTANETKKGVRIGGWSVEPLIKEDA